MKITKSQLKQIIKEELKSVLEVKYDDEGNPLYATSQDDSATPDDAEVLVRGYGGLEIGQIKRRLINQLSEAAQAAAAGEFRRIGSSQLKLLALFLETLEEHNAVDDGEQLEEIKASMMGTDWASFPPHDFESHGEGSMAINQLYRTEELAKNLQGMISKDSNLEEWVESKITKAQDYLSSVMNYMSGKKRQIAEAEEGDYDPDAPINQLGADSDEESAEVRAAELNAATVDLEELRNEISRLLEDPDESDLQAAQDRLSDMELPEEE